MKNSEKLFFETWKAAMQLGAYAGCHQLPERSFFLKGYQFPVCARCCGVLVGELLALVVPTKHKKKRLILSFVLLLVMFVDWFVQFLGIKESTNKRRFATGLGGGFGSWSIHIMLLKKIFAPKTEHIKNVQR